MKCTMPDDEFRKIHRKIPVWFKKPNQINSHILIKYLENTNDGNYIEIERLSDLCNSIETFKTNFAQMCTIGKKNHACIFEKQNALVRLIPSIKKFVLDNYNQFLKEQKK